MRSAVSPEQPVTAQVADLQAIGETLKVFFPIPGFDAIMDRLGLRWNPPSWERDINPGITGSMTDRLAELGHSLLTAGIPIRIEPSIRQKAIDGQFQPEHTRWVVQVRTCKYKKWFRRSRGRI